MNETGFIWRVTIGEVIGACSFIASIVGGVWVLSKRFATIERAITKLEGALLNVNTKLEPLWGWWNEYAPTKLINTKSSDEIEHEIRGLQEVLILRKHIAERKGAS